MPPLPCVSARLETILGLERIAHDAADHCPIPVHINEPCSINLGAGAVYSSQLHPHPQAPALP